MPDDVDLEDDWKDVRGTVLKPDSFPSGEKVSDGGIIVPEGKFEGELGVRILPADDPGEPRQIGFVMHEMTDEDLDEQDSPENLASLEVQRESVSPEVQRFATNHAARYPPEPPAGHEGMYRWPAGVGWTTKDMLPELYGRPWNNAAANFLACLRPSAVRVVGPGEGLTADSYVWRVTVLLDEGGNIQRIYQEVEIGLVGFRNGWDASQYLAGNEEFLRQPQPRGIINLEGVRRLELHSDDDEDDVPNNQ